MQKELLAVYLEELGHFLEYDPVRFKREYFYLSLQRNLQILGAFAFLSRQRGKIFFAPFIRPALDSLKNMLSRPGGESYPALTGLVDSCLKRLAESMKKNSEASTGRN